MKTFIVTRTTVETFMIQSEDAEGDIAHGNIVLDNEMPTHSDTEIVSREMLDAPEYRVVIIEENIGWNEFKGDFENAEDEAEAKEAFYKHGVYGYSVEMRTVVDGQWDDVDSCFGFLGNERQYMLDVAIEHIPKGVDAKIWESFCNAAEATETNETVTGIGASEAA